MCCLVEKLPQKNSHRYLGNLFYAHHPKEYQRNDECAYRKSYGIVHGKPAKNTGYALTKIKRKMLMSFGPSVQSASALKFFGGGHIDDSKRFTRVAKIVPREDANELTQEFKVLANEWKNATIAASSLSDLFTHPAYQRIMAMGKPALPFILRDLKQHSGHWFHALRFIVGKDIAAGTERVPDARLAWLEWGHKNGYL